MQRYLFHKVVFLLAGMLFFRHVPVVAARADSLSRNIVQNVDSIYEAQRLLSRSMQLTDSGKQDEAALLAQNAYRLSLRNEDIKGQADALAWQAKLEMQKGNSPQALYYFWQTIKLKSAFHDKGFSERIYYNMAVTLASMKQYAAALKYFDKAGRLKERKARRNAASPALATDIDTAWVEADPADDGNMENAMPDTAACPVLWADTRVDLLDSNAIVIDSDTLMIRQTDQKRRERRLTGAAIMDAFDDGKEAVAYGLLLHIKQPVSGKRKTYAGINTVGHMFVTLIKYNRDGGSTARTFGFYPDKDNFLSATPFSPGSSATFRDDAAHEWDETVAKFIPRRTFHRILRMVRKYSRARYNLNHNNCTDFGLCIAGIAGIKISETHGSWPFGSGNNPGSAGQSVLDRKVEDMDQDGFMILDLIKDPMQ